MQKWLKAFLKGKFGKNSEKTVQLKKEKEIISF